MSDKMAPPPLPGSTSDRLRLLCPFFPKPDQNVMREAADRIEAMEATLSLARDLAQALGCYPESGHPFWKAMEALGHE